MSLAKEMLNKKVWAVVGVSADRSKYGFKVYDRLKQAGYRVYAVNPRLKELDGEEAYPDLAALPEKPDVVNCVVPPLVTASIIHHCAEQGILYVWMQPGSDSQEAVNLAEDKKINTLRACVLLELNRR